MDEGDTVAKRGDEAFALGNICWKVYDQVRRSRIPQYPSLVQTFLLLARRSPRSCSLRSQLHAYRLLDTIIQTYNSIRPSPLARLAAPCTTMAERVGYWYWVGKLALAKGDVRRVRSVFLICVRENTC